MNWFWPLFSSSKSLASKVSPAHETKANKVRSRSQEFRARNGTANLVGDIKVNKSKGRPNRAAYIAVDVVRATSRLKMLVKKRRSKSEEHRKEYVAEVAQQMRRRSEEFLTRDPQYKNSAPLHRKHGRLNRGSILWHDIKDPVVHLVSVVSGGNKPTNKVTPEQANATFED